jgi:hypothetical protein
MWTVSKTWSQDARGEPKAVQIKNNARKKLLTRQAEMPLPELERS